MAKYYSIFMVFRADRDLQPRFVTKVWGEGAPSEKEENFYLNELRKAAKREGRTVEIFQRAGTNGRAGIYSKNGTGTDKIDPLD